MSNIYDFITNRDVYDLVLKREPFIPGDFVTFMQHESQGTDDFLVNFREKITKEKGLHIKESVATLQLNSDDDIEDNDEFEAAEIYQERYPDYVRQFVVMNITNSESDWYISKTWKQRQLNYPNVGYLVGTLLYKLHNEEMIDRSRYVIRSFLALLGKYAIEEYQSLTGETVTEDELFIFKVDDFEYYTGDKEVTGTESDIEI